MTDREIMQQALEALEALTDNYDDNAVGKEIDAIIALRKRLARPDPLQRLTDVQQEIEAALAQPEQKPVLQDIEQYRMQMASISTAAIGYWKEGDGIHPDYDTPALRDVADLYAKYELLVAQPKQKREWQGLTDEEIYECEKVGAIHYQRHKCSVTTADDPQWHFAGAIEAKLKEKND